MKRIAILLAILIGTTPATPLLAAHPLEQRVVEHTLSNGIRLLVLERHFSPTVSIRMMFRTGSVDEIQGKTGLAHMFEHMMFKGTKTMGTKNYGAEAPILEKVDQAQRDLDEEKRKNAKADQKKIGELIEKVRMLETQARSFAVDNELWNLYEREGASQLNASTARDFTQYIVDLPSNKLELWAILDSDRLKNPVFRQFYPEREVVKEERRMRVDTDPEGKLFEQFVSAAYQVHPYRNPTIGWEADLDHLHVSDLVDFYKKHYIPRELTIAIVGDVDAKKTVAMVDRYFGSWNPSSNSRPHPSPEPPQTGLRRISVPFDAQPQVVLGYHIPTYPDADQIVSYAVSYLLGSGTTSRLYKSLVEKRKVATSIDTAQDYPGDRYPSLFIFSARPRHPHTNTQVVQAIDQELERLKKEPVQEWELEKIRAAVEVGILETLQTNSGLASTLVYNQTVFGDWRFLIHFQDQIRKITPKDIQSFASRYFTKENLTIAFLETTTKR